MQAGHVDLPKNAPAVRTVIGNLGTELAHLLYVAQYALCDPSLHLDVVGNGLAFARSFAGR